MADTQKKSAALVKRDTVDIVTERVKQFQNAGEIHFPVNYSPENALKSAWLILQETKDRNDKPALEICTKDSIANSLLNMVVQGLNPAKKQCYFIVYGNQLQMQRSYFGSVAVAKQVNERVEDIIGEVIYAGDVFRTAKKRGRTVLVEHAQDFANMDKANIVGAYANILYTDGNDECIVMTLAQIHQAWKQSKMGVFDERGNLKSTSTHGKFTEEMCKKTVINKAAKHIVNTSDDHNLIVKTFQRTADESSEAEAKAQIAENANAELIDFEVDPSTGEAVPVDRTGDHQAVEREEEAQAEEGLREQDGPEF